MMDTVGLRIRKRRIEIGLTISQLAEKTGVTSAHVSQIERGVTRASLSVLRTIAATLNMPTSQLFAVSEDSIYVTRAEKRRKIASDDGCSFIEVLSTVWKSGYSSTGVSILRYKPGCRETEMAVHSQTEYTYLLSGKAVVHTSDGDEIYELRAGDGIYLPPHTPHAYENPGLEENRLLCVLCDI